MRSSYYSSGSGDAALILAVIVILASIVTTIIAQWKLFEKAGEKGWKCLIPIYGAYVWYQLTWSVGAWAAILAVSLLSLLTASIQVLALILSIVLLIMYIIGCHKASLSYGKGGGFTVGLFFLPVIFYQILAFGQSEYVGPAGVPVCRDTGRETAEGNEQGLTDKTADAQTGGSGLIWILTGVFLTVTLLFFAAETILSMENYRVNRGIFGSPFVGLKNVQALVNSARYFPAILNSVLYGAAGAGLAAAAGFAGAALGKSGNAVRKISIAAGLLLMAVPRLAWETLLINPDAIVLTKAICDALPWCGLSLAAGALLSCRFGDKGLRAALIVPAMRIITMLSGTNGVISLYPMGTGGNGMSADRLLYEYGLYMGQYSVGSAGYVMTALINLLFAAIGIALLAAMINRTEQDPIKKSEKFADAVPGIAAALLLILGGFLAVRSAGSVFSSAKLTEALKNTLAEMIITGVLGFGFFLLIQLLAGKKGAPGAVSRAVFVFALLSLSQMWITKYMLIRAMGLADTAFAVALCWLLNPLTLALAAVLALSRPASMGACVRNAAAVAMMALVLGIGEIRGSNVYLYGHMDFSLFLYRSYISTNTTEAVSTDSVRTAAWGMTMLVYALPLGAGIAMACMSPGKE